MADLIASQLVNLDNRVSLGLSGTIESTNYVLEVIENHFHTAQQCYGASSNNFSRGSTAAFTINAGSGAYAEEIQLHDGTVIESGSTTKYFDMNTIYAYSVATANRLIFLQFMYGTQNTGVTCTFTNATEKVNKVAHGLTNDTKIMFSNTGGALPTGFVNYIVYYVVNKNNDDFQVSLTIGGAAVTISDDGSGTNKYHTLNQTILTETYIGFASTSADSYPFVLSALRTTCNNRVWVRAKAEGGTNSITCLFGLHTYGA